MGEALEIIINFLEVLLNYINKNKEWLFSGFGNAIIFTVIGSLLLFIIKAIIKRVNLWRIRKGTLDEIINSHQNKRNGLYIDSDLSKVLNIEKIINHNYSEYTDYLIVQYGSSIKNQRDKPNDYDFIVLLLGNPINERKEIVKVGDNPKYKIENKVQVDIVFRDYKSFLFAACSGMPYENSVINDSKLIHGHKGYYEWLKRLSKNILMDKDFLLRRYKDKLITEREVLNKAINYGDFYELVRAGYFYITSLLQSYHIKQMDKIITQNDVSKISNVYKIGEIIKVEKYRIIYTRLIRFLKRLEIPTTKKDIEADIDLLIKHLHDEVIVD